MTTLGTLRGMVEFCSDFVAMRFKVTGKVFAMWHAVRENGDHFVLPAVVKGATKDMASRMVRAQFAHARVVRYVFVDEAWTATIYGKSAAAAEAEANAWLNEHGSLEHYPGRREIVTFFGEDASGALSAEREIIRKVNSRPRLGPLEVTDDIKEFRGRFAGMLPRLEGTMQ